MSMEIFSQRKSNSGKEEYMRYRDRAKQIEKDTNKKSWRENLDIKWANCTKP